ncbi:MAG: eukaryotic-like serine/threonine-protein kinase, partial [Gemmatimonadales bacterium]|nr:eukaryotic-like serine/threonine-protein kinase [Gemmatimonadales bacterium]
RPVALKLLRPELAAALGPERFQREIHLAAGLQHPNILTVLDSGGSETLLWFTMPFVEGESLRSHLDRERQLPVDEAVRIACEVADALSCAHGRGIVHRDIKPGNILLSGGHALVTDFGIAHSVDDNTADRLTESGMIVGTPAYMSPEQASGERNLDSRTDIYALGCVLYEMLAGEPPFTGPTAQSVAAKRLTDPVPAVSRVRDTVPAGVERALTRAMAKVPADRFASAADFADALRTGLSDRSGVPPRKRSVLQWPIAGAAALLLLAAVFYLKRGSGPGEPAGLIPLAVLPFRTFGAAGDSSVLAIGIPDAIITRLAGLRQMRLRPTSAVLPYAGKDADPSEIGRALAVRYLLTGTVQAAADRLRVSVQLVRAGDGSPLWGSHYDLARKDLLTLQDSIAERVSASLAVRLSADEHDRLYRRYTANPAAYEWYLRGRSQLARVTEDGTKAALQAFERALALDPSYALAQAGLAMASADMHLRFASGPEVKVWGERAKAEAARALALDPNLAEAHLAKAAVSRKADFDWETTLEESGRALALNPNLDVAHYFREAAFYHLGLFDLAEREDREALGMDPADQVEQLRTRGVVAFLQGRYPEAVKNLELARRSSSRAYTDSYLAQAYYYSGDSTRAIATLDSLSQIASAPAANRARAALASFLAHQGEREEAEALIALVVGKEGYVDHHVAYSLGAAYAQLGQPEQAASWLTQAMETGFPCYPWFERDPLLDPVRQDPRVSRVLTQLRQSWEAAKSRYS